jgi:hypothetical protein
MILAARFCRADRRLPGFGPGLPARYGEAGDLDSEHDLADEGWIASAQASTPLGGARTAEPQDGSPYGYLPSHVSV